MPVPRLRLIQGALSKLPDELSVGEIVQVADPRNPNRPPRYAIVQMLDARRQNSYSIFDLDAGLITNNVERKYLTRMPDKHPRFWQSLLETHLTQVLAGQKCVYHKATHVIESAYFDDGWKLWVQRLRRWGLDRKESCCLRDVKLTGSK